MNLLDCFIFAVVSILITGTRCVVTHTEVIAAEGSQAVLPCQYPPQMISHPTTVVWSHMDKGTIWRKERNGLEYRGSKWSQRVQCPHNQFDSGKYNLQINSVTEEDGGLYSCKLDGGKHVDIQVMLRIIKASISPPDPISGTYASLSCTLTPWRHGVSVEWRLNNTPYFPQTRTIWKDENSLKNLRVTEKESGTWTCVVNNNGNKGQASATMSVKGIIQPPKDNAKVYAAVGSPVTLPCVFSPDLRPLSLGWTKVNAGRPPTRNLQLLSLLPSSSPARPQWDKSIHINEVMYEDEGNYTCAGSVGSQRLTRTMQLVVAKVVPLKKKSSMTLTCQLADDSNVIRYEWVHVNYDQNGTALPGPIWDTKDVTISDGSEESWGEWTCNFYGKEGLLGNVTYNIHLMSGLSGRKSSGLSNNTATVVGLVFLLAVLLLILAQMYKNHQRRKRIFQYPALETIVHTISNEREEQERNRGKN